MSECLSLIDPTWELIDPNPNIWSLFSEFDERFFKGFLTSSFVELKWSTSRMTSTAGLCCWNPRTNFATIILSQPLLQLRSRADLVETLLHEMIHAFLFVTRQDDNHESHGPKFHIHMYRINKESGTNITVYHTFHDEVRHYQQHVWKCDGPCAGRPPYFGTVRRANNRKPGSYDYWWASHQATCGGNFIKMSEPLKMVKPKQNPKGKPSIDDVKSNKRIDDFFKITSPAKNSSLSSPAEKSKKSSPTVKHGDIRKFMSPIKSPSSQPIFPGKGHRLGSSLESEMPVKRLKLEDIENDEVSNSQVNTFPSTSYFKNQVKTFQPILTNSVPKRKENELPKYPQLPDIIPKIVTQSSPACKSTVESSVEKTSLNKPESKQLLLTLSDDEDSFTYDLPDFDLDESIIIDVIKSTSSNTQKGCADPTEPATIQASTSSKTVKPQVSDSDNEEDAFTYELPNFPPFLGPGYRLGSTCENKQTGPTHKDANLDVNSSHRPQIVKLD